MSEVGAVERHYAYPLVTWGSTFLGAAVALITAFMLNVLGAALGVGAAGFFQTTPATATVLGMLWVALANLVALGFGAWVAGRSTANPDHHGGTLQGIAVWAVTSFAILFIAGSALAGLGGAALQTADTAAASLGAASPPANPAPVSPGVADPNAMGQSVYGQASEPGAGMAQADQAPQSPPPAQQASPQGAAQQGAALQDATSKVAAATASAAFGTFLAMVLGLVAAIFGARAGARHPNWSDRPRFTYVERRH